jgi:hypothetical protein
MQQGSARVLAIHLATATVVINSSDLTPMSPRSTNMAFAYIAPVRLPTHLFFERSLSQPFLKNSFEAFLDLILYAIRKGAKMRDQCHTGGG